MIVPDQHALVPLLIVLKKLGLNANHAIGGFTFFGSDFGKVVTGLSHGVHHIEFRPDGIAIDGVHVYYRSKSKYDWI